MLMCSQADPRGYSLAVFAKNLTEAALSVRLFLGGYRIFLKARCVRVGKIRRILIRLIEHFSLATRTSAVFPDQRRD
jgi:NADH:ubiquinone oxidoreductase subunit H